MENEQLTFEFNERPTIKGFPELRWTGKRPYTSTQYYPAQLKETYGEPDDETGWINKLSPVVNKIVFLKGEFLHKVHRIKLTYNKFISLTDNFRFRLTL